MPRLQKDVWRSPFKDAKKSSRVVGVGSVGLRAYLVMLFGKSAALDEAIAYWAEGYGDQTERDYKALLKAIADAKVPAEMEI